MKKVSLLLVVVMLWMGSAYAQTNNPEEAKFKISSHTEDVTVLLLTPDKKNLVSASRDKEIKFYNMNNGEVTRTIPVNTSAVVSLGFSKDGKLLLAGLGDGTAVMYNAESGEVIQRFRNHSAPVTAVSFSTDAAARFIYTAGGDGKIQVYDRSANNKFVKTIALDEGVHTMCMVFDAPGKNIIVGSSDGKVRIIDPATSQVVNTYDGHSEEITGIALSSDGKYFATSSNDRKAILWDATNGTNIKTFEGHGWKVQDIDISPDNKQIATVSNDGTLKLWDVESGKNTKTHSLKNKRTFYNVVFHPDMKYVISGMQVKNQLTQAIMWWEIK